MKIDVKDTSGKVVGSVELDDAVFGAEVNEHLLWEVVKWQRAKARSGTASSLRPSEVRGTGKKPYRQKGTGNARRGMQRGAHHVGGGRVFGPKPRDYEYTLPRKVKKAGLRSALSLRAREQKLIVLDAFSVDKLPDAGGKGDGKGGRLTKRVSQALAKLGAGKALVIDSSDNALLQRGTKNLAGAKWIAPEGLNVYDILDHPSLVIVAGAIKEIEQRLTPKEQA